MNTGVCVVCHGGFNHHPSDVYMCRLCGADASISALATAAKHGPMTGPASHVLACRALARVRASEAKVHLVQPSGDVRRRWRRFMAAEGCAGAYAVAELLALLSESASREGAGPWDALDGSSALQREPGAGS